MNDATRLGLLSWPREGTAQKEIDPVRCRFALGHVRYMVLCGDAGSLHSNHQAAQRVQAPARRICNHDAKLSAWYFWHLMFVEHVSIHLPLMLHEDGSHHR